MGMIGAGYGPQNWSDRLAIIGAALRDASPGSSGDNLVRQQQMMLGRQQFQLQRQAMSQMLGLFGGQPQYQDGADPSVAAPQGAAAAAGATPASSTPIDDMTGALAQATGNAPPAAAAAPPQPYVYRPPVQTSSGQASLGDPATQRTLAMASMLGVPGAKEITDLLDKARPTVKIGPDGTPYDERGVGSLMQHFANRTNVNGQIVDLNDAGNTNRVIPTAPVPGANPVFDNRGNVIDWQLPGGAARAIGAAEAAKVGADEATKLPYVGPTAFAQSRGSTRGNLQTIPNADGSSTLMPGDEYLDGRATAAGGAPGPPGGPGPIPQIGAAAAAGGPARAGLGTSQSSADKTLADARAATQAEREKLQPKELGALRDLDSASSLTSSTIHQILGDVQDAKTGRWGPGGRSMISPLTVGLGANLKGFDGTPAHDLDQLLEHVNAATSMANLQQLRDNSPTGAGLGRVTQTEIKLLAAMNGSTDQGQRGPQFEQNLRRQLSQLDNAIATRRQVYQATYGNVQQPSGGARQTLPPPQPGQIVKGYKFLGGNPADQRSWARPQ